MEDPVAVGSHESLVTVASPLASPRLPRAEDDGAGVEPPPVPPKDPEAIAELYKNELNTRLGELAGTVGEPLPPAPVLGPAPPPPIGDWRDTEEWWRLSVAALILLTLVFALMIVEKKCDRAACQKHPPARLPACIGDDHPLADCNLVAAAYSSIILPVQPWSVYGISSELPKRWLAPGEFGIPLCMVCSAQIAKTKLGIPNGVSARCFCAATVHETTAESGAPRSWALNGTNLDLATNTTAYTFGIGEYEAVHRALCSLEPHDQQQACLEQAAAPMRRPKTDPLRVYDREL